MNLVDKPIFIDTNILVYANISSYPLHSLALSKLQALIDAEAELWISRQILREYIASVTRPQTYAEPQPIQVACERARQFATNFNLAEDTAAVTDALLDLITQVKIGGRQIHDANIVATMLAYGIPYLWTHNTQDFARFGDQITVVPLVTEESDSEEKSQ